MTMIDNKRKKAKNRETKKNLNLTKTKRERKRDREGECKRISLRLPIVTTMMKILAFFFLGSVIVSI